MKTFYCFIYFVSINVWISVCSELLMTKPHFYRRNLFQCENINQQEIENYFWLIAVNCYWAMVSLKLWKCVQTPMHLIPLDWNEKILSFYFIIFFRLLPSPRNGVIFYSPVSIKILIITQFFFQEYATFSNFLNDLLVCIWCPIKYF